MNPKKKPTENFEACRDLSGRRLRNIYNEQRLEEWRKKHGEEEKFVEEELKEYEKNKKTMGEAMRASNYKIDEKYKKQVQNGALTMIESLKDVGAQRKKAKGMKKRLIKENDKTNDKVSKGANMKQKKGIIFEELFGNINKKEGEGKDCGKEGVDEMFDKEMKDFISNYSKNKKRQKLDKCEKEK